MDALDAYVGERLRAGAGHAQIEGELALLGWTPEQARQALRDALIARGAPPAPVRAADATPQSSSALDVGMSLFGFALLTIVAYSLIRLGFALAELTFPDVLGKTQASTLSRTIHHAMASLLVALPAYALALRWWFARYRVGAARREPALTRWITYGVLLAASLTMIGDLIAVVYSLLQGEATARFVAKASWLLLLAMLVVALYGLERRQLQYGRMPPRGALATVAAAGLLLALLACGLGLRMAGTPALARAQALDAERVVRLKRLADCAERYARDGGELPASLDAMLASTRDATCTDAARDPATQRPFEYRVLSPLREQGKSREGRIELCAVFELAAPPRGSGARPAPGTWQEHDAGRVCRAISVRVPVARTP